MQAADLLVGLKLHYSPAGKSTLLQILAGQYMVGPEAVRILGRPAFHDIQLTSSGQLSYLGQQWRRDIAFAGSNVPIQVALVSVYMLAPLAPCNARPAAINCKQGWWPCRHCSTARRGSHSSRSASTASM